MKPNSFQLDEFRVRYHGGMAKGGHGLSKVSPGPTMPDPSTPCGQATHKMAVFYPFGHHTPYAYV
jgi:hypothetical protein